MEDTKKQWHPAFTAALMLELKKSWGNLVFEKEHNLNTKPLEIDLLVIKKNAAVMVENEIGKLFKGHNIIEYKSPKDHLDIVLDGELRETQTADYFSSLCPIDCTVPSLNA